MPQSKTILLAGGGTGGHLYPGIAVAEALVKLMPGVRCLFLCTKKEIDKRILDGTPFPYVQQPIVPPVTSIGGLLKFWKAWRETKDLVKQLIGDENPVACIGLGGYAAGVGVEQAAKKKIATAILNPDVIPGKANRYLMKHSRAVCCQFEATSLHVDSTNQSKLVFTGCPIRADIRKLPPQPEAAKRLGLDPSLRTLLVTGASLGAQTVNEAVITMLASIKVQGWQILHLSGRDHADSVRAGYRELKMTNARVVDFTPAMADVWAVSDLAISRSGASSCAELTACGVPSILLPYPFHKDMHQRANAKVLADAGAAFLVDDEKDRRKNSDKIKPLVELLLYDGNKRAEMARAAKNLGKPDAAEQVAQVVMRMLK